MRRLAGLVPHTGTRAAAGSPRVHYEALPGRGGGGGGVTQTAAIAKSRQRAEGALRGEGREPKRRDQRIAGGTLTAKAGPASAQIAAKRTCATALLLERMLDVLTLCCLSTCEHALTLR